MMASIQNIIVILAFVSLTLTFANGSSIPSFVFGKCQVGRDNCRDCYISLAQSLFQSDENVFNLSQAFFPPDTNTPEFVVVRYHFENESKHEERVWFWGASASYFIYPLSTFQFLSLFFGKPEAYWTGEVDVTLNATECLGAKEEHLIMLTQRLRIYVEQYDIRPSIDDTYQAEAMNSDAFDDLFNKNANRLINIVICIQTLGVLMIFVCAVIIIACAVKSENTEQFFVKKIKYKSTISKQSILISLSVNGLMLLMYAIAMDGAAVHFRNNNHLTYLKAVNHLKAGIGQPFDVLYNLPIVALVFDLFALLMYIIAVSVCVCCWKQDGDYQTSVFSVTPSLLGPLLCIISHSPYIAIAYVNDAYYAGSIFVYYMVVFFVCFAAIHITTKSYFEFWVLNESNVWKCLQEKDPEKCDFRHLVCPLAVSFLLLFLLLTVPIVICYFVIIPLNGSISGAPHQLIGFYQTVIIFLGIFIAYKTVLHKKSGLKSAVMARKNTLSTTNWDELPEEEKKRKFYDMVISVVEHKYNKYEQNNNNIQHSPSSGPASTPPPSTPPPSRSLQEERGEENTDEVEQHSPIFEPLSASSSDVGKQDNIPLLPLKD